MFKPNVEIEKIIRESFGSNEDFEKFLKEIELLNDNKERRAILDKHFACLQSFINEVRKHSNPFLFDKKIIRTLEQWLEFQPFQRKGNAKVAGRPHLDDMGYFIWVISREINHKKGPYRGDTDWKKVLKIIERYRYKFRFLNDISTNPRTLKDLRNRYQKNYPNYPTRDWPAKKRREMLAAELKKLRISMQSIRRATDKK